MSFLDETLAVAAMGLGGAADNEFARQYQKMQQDKQQYASALDKQVSGSHYKSKAIQPVEYIHANGLGFCEGNVIKYVTRWKEKNGIDDLEKALHYLEILIQLERRKEITPSQPSSS